MEARALSMPYGFISNIFPSCKGIVDGLIGSWENPLMNRVVSTSILSYSTSNSLNMSSLEPSTTRVEETHFHMDLVIISLRKNYYVIFFDTM